MDWKKLGVVVALAIAAGLYVAAAMPWGMMGYGGYGMPMMGYGYGGGMMGGYGGGYNYAPQYDYNTTPQQPVQQPWGYYVPHGYHWHGCPMMWYW